MDPRQMKVKDLMQTKVKKVTKGTSLAAAAKVMHDNGLSCLMVEPEDNRDTFGIITRKDIVQALIEECVGGPCHVVGDVMTKPVISVNTELSIYHCLKIMRMVGVRRLPVLEGSRLVGILSNTDIFTNLVKHLG